MNFKNFFIVVQLQLSSFTPHYSPQPSHPHLPPLLPPPLVLSLCPYSSWFFTELSLPKCSGIDEKLQVFENALIISSLNLSLNFGSIILYSFKQSHLDRNADKNLTNNTVIWYINNHFKLRLWLRRLIEVEKKLYLKNIFNLISNLSHWLGDYNCTNNILLTTLLRQKQRKPSHSQTTQCLFKSVKWSWWLGCSPPMLIVEGWVCWNLYNC